MFSIWKTRFILWKKQAVSLMFWLLFPIIGTISIISVAEFFQGDTKIPVGIVMEDDTKLASDLHEAISSSPLLRIVDVSNVEARQMVSAHTLDSAFVIEKSFQEDIKKGNRNRIITSYSTDLSFGYIPVKEMVISFVQEASGKSKTAYTVQELSKESDINWTWDEIVRTTNDIQLRENLLHTDFRFHTESQRAEKTDSNIWNTWGIWSSLSLLATFFLFDWIIKERNNTLFQRLPFMRISMKKYLLCNLLIYGILLLVFDLIAAFTFQLFLNESINEDLISHLFQLRITLIIGAFLFALYFKNTFLYYSVSITITLLIFILSNVLIPIEGTTYLWLHPFYHFLKLDGINLWIFPLALFLIIWWLKGGKTNHA